MGYEAVLLADSTSRWAEALREFASRNGELPIEEGYPAGLASALAAFYERAGRVVNRNGSQGSITVIGAVSPPGGDMTEPVSAQTERFVRCLWSLDRDLAYARHYPAVSWRRSFSRDAETVAAWHTAERNAAWGSDRLRAIALLGQADRLEPMVELVGLIGLPDHDRATLLAARMLREAVLQQNALSPNDASCGPVKQAALLRAVIDLADRAVALVGRGVKAEALERYDLSDLTRLRDLVPADDGDAVAARASDLLLRMEEDLAK
jgi:V/A-type H+-transporting ATPase subunit A